MFEPGNEPPHVLTYQRGMRLLECLRCRAVLTALPSATAQDRLTLTRTFRMAHDYCGASAPAPTGVAYTCPFCLRVSHHPDDLANRYCVCCGSADDSLPKDCPHDRTIRLEESASV